MTRLHTMYQAWLLVAATKSQQKQIEYLAERYAEEVNAILETGYVFLPEWEEEFDWFCSEAAKLTNLTEEQFCGLGALVKRCKKKDFVYVVWPEKKEVSLWLGQDLKAAEFFGGTMHVNQGEIYIKIPFDTLDRFF